ncbi:MAG: glycine--tRNA ligase subunit beta [Pseudomonadota bacterium]|nr:glycine--tRNA ligase subunit beta [Pseudomonadota bacterium]
MSDFILELLSEEIPSRMQKQASEYLLREFRQQTEGAGLEVGQIQSFYSTRRLTLIATNMKSQTAKMTVEKLGPRIDSPDDAINGFLRSNNIKSIDDCDILDDKKGKRYRYIETVPAKTAITILPPIIEEIIRKFSWPKSMRWGNGNSRWVRPLRNIMAIIYDNKSVNKLKINIEGLLANDYTFGHRFLKNQKIYIKGVSDYFEALTNHLVIADQGQRRELILEQISKIEKKFDISVIKDEKLLEEVSGLVEWPVALCAEFDEKFLNLPDEVLQTSMRSHQKYFSVAEKKTKNLTNKFILISNIQTSDEGNSIILGNQRVLSARLYDAKYFWDRDIDQPLIDNLRLLNSVTYHQKLGSLGSKVERIELIALELDQALGLNLENIPTAAKLIKNDLLSEMVGEFPDLQGIMGSYYAERQGYDEDICDAIKNHYMPVTPRDETPKKSLSFCLSVADKIDTLVGFWSIGETPTGSKDPYALRRAGNGLIRNIIENKLDFDFAHFIEKILHKSDLIKKQQHSSVREGLINFMNERFRSYILDNKYDVRICDAIFRDDDFVNYYMTLSRIQLLSQFIKTDKGLSLLKALKRINNILDPSLPNNTFGQIDQKIFTSDVENNLYTGIEKLRKKKSKSNDITEIKKYLSDVSILADPINDFFEQIIVNDEDKNIRTNRFFLLNSVIDLISNIFDISKIEL